MFYCKLCQVKNNYPESISTSVGACEICGTIAVCYDVPSSRLPKDSLEEGIPIDEYLDDIYDKMTNLSHTSQIILLGKIAQRLTLDKTAAAIRETLNK